MKNSAWYHQLWRKKLDEHPVPDNAHTAWADMQSLLDKHLPVSNAITPKPAHSFGRWLISKAGFIIAAAVITTAVVFVLVKHPFKKEKAGKKQQENIIKVPVQKPDTGVKATPVTSEVSPKTGISDSIETSENKPNTNNQAVKETAIGNKASGQNTGNKPVPLIQQSASRSTGHHQGYQKNSAGNPVQGIAGNKPGQINNSGAISNSSQTPLLMLNPPANSFPFLADTTGANTNNNNNKTDGYAAGTGNPALVIPNIINQYTKDGITTDVSGKKNAGKKDKTAKEGTAETKKLKDNKIRNNDPSRFNYGLTAGLNMATAGTNFRAGLWAGYQLQPKWNLSAGLNLDINGSVNGTYTHASYSPRDSVPFTVSDQRKIYTLSLPVIFAYQVSKTLSITGGPQFSFTAKQARVTGKTPSSYFGPVLNTRDTLNHTNTIDSALNFTKINTFNIGITGGVSLHFNRFYIDARYLQNITPYNFTNSILGNSPLYYRSFQIGIRYQFKK